LAARRTPHHPVPAFADDCLGSRPQPRSLREFGITEAEGYLARLRADATLKESQRRPTLTALKRFFRFLRDTGRMDYDDAVYVLDLLKEQG
jgi:hypothetical protein